MGNNKRKKIKSTVIVPQKEEHHIEEGKKQKVEENENNSHKLSHRGKRSRSEGDSSETLHDFKEYGQRNSNNRISRKDDKVKEDLRTKLNKSKQTKERSRSRSRSKQRSSPSNLVTDKATTTKTVKDKEIYSSGTEMDYEDDLQISETQTDKNSGVSDSEDEEIKQTFRQKGDKFFIERSEDETVVTPTDFGFLSRDQDTERAFYEGIGPTDDGSEVIFNNKSAKEINKRDKKTRKRDRSRSKSKDRRKKRIKKKLTYSSSSYSSDGLSDDYESSRKRGHKRRKARKHKKRKRSISSSSSSDDSSDQEDQISKLVKQYVKKGKKNKDHNKVSEIVKQVVQQINNISGKSSICNPNNLEQKQVEGQRNPNMTSETPKNNEITPTEIPALELEVKEMVNKLKSPSDATLYVPAVQQGITRNVNLPRFNFGNQVQDFGSPQIVSHNFKDNNKPKDQLQEDDPGLDFINNFIQSIRIGQEDDKDGRKETTINAEQKLQAERNAHAKEISDRAILEAERKKAELQTPQGMSQNVMNNFKLLLKKVIADNDDDDFFHITCHIEPQIIAKIQQGLYIELDKLLQKPEHLKTDVDGRQVLVERDGEQYYVPYKGKDSVKINNVKKWEEAFRVYAAIYCQANPSRSVEILQYVDVINQAAIKFPWEKVAKYDFVFRHLMAKKPERSWAKTYTQMWTLELSGSDQRKNYENQRKQNYSQSNQKTGSWKDNCCWKYNRSDSCPFGRQCRFDHRCTFCGSYSHPSCHCNKKPGGSNSRRNSNEGRYERSDRKTF